MTSGENRSIASCGRACLTQFDFLCRLLQSPDSRCHDRISLVALQGELARFKAWAENTGALQRAHLQKSLDYRLREALHIHSRVIKVLEHLYESLHEG
jgi:hypothetical protein